MKSSEVTSDVNDLLAQKLDVAAKVLDSLRRDLGDTIMFKGNSDHMIANVPVYSTGSIGIDYVTGVNGIPRGRITEIYGPESSGKSSLCLSIVAQAQKQGDLCAFIDMEHALDPSYASRIGVDMSNLFISQPDNGEQAVQVAEECIRSGVFGIVVIDSAAALVPKAELDGEFGDQHVGLQARLITKALRRVNGALGSTKTALIFTNQLRDKIGGMTGFGMGANETTPGGRALKFYASLRIDMRRIQTIKVGDSEVGNRTRVQIKKNKVGAPFGKCEFDIMFDEGISLTGEIIDYAVEHGIITKSGAFFRYNGNTLAQGREKLRQALMSNFDLAFEIHSAILQKLGMPPVDKSSVVYNKLSKVALGKADLDPEIDELPDEYQAEVVIDSDGVIED